jgi:hypothetical protein
MKRTIYDCWNCRHSNSYNPYGIDYCEAHDTRCSFAHDDCDDFEPDTDNADTRDISRQALRTATVKASIILAVIITCLLMAILSSCTTTKYVTVPEVHEHWHHSTDTIRQTDSIIDHQTTTIREVDSATMAQYGIQMKQMQWAWLIETNRLQRELSELRQSHTDTIHERDSIPYPVEVVKEVPAQLSWWQQARLHLANILLYLLAVVAIIFVGRKYLRKVNPMP